MTKLGGQVALVTGGAAGLGRAIAERLARDGARVVITDIDEPTGMRAAQVGQLRFLRHDVRSEEGWHTIIAQTEEMFGSLHILVNNAGIVGFSDQMSPENTPLDVWRSIFAVNVEGVFLGCKAAIPAIARAKGGSIVNMASTSALMASPYATAYGASKAAVRQLTKSVAQHCAEQGLNIRCNSIHPGNVHTKIWDDALERMAATRGMAPDAMLAEVKARAPLGDFTHASDVAAMIAFLVSDEGARITGAKMIVDAGVVNCDTFHLSERFRRAIGSPGA